jgi:hypothetical protein
MKARTYARRRPGRRRRARSREGAVMLVVLLILMVATASAAVAVSSTQSELQAAGNERVAVQTRYVAETGLATTITWLEMVVQNKSAWDAAMDEFDVDKGGVPPGMEYFAEPELTGTTHQTGRFSMAAEMDLRQNPTLETVALANAAPYMTTAGSGGGGGGGGSGGGGGAAGTTAGTGGGSGSSGGGGGGGSGGSGPSTDTTGSFGPKQGYGIPADGFVVDMTDCRDAPAALVAGMDANDESGTETPKPQYCVLTGRGRLEPTGGNATEVEWDVQSGVKKFRQKIYSSAHDARATIIIPPPPP